MTHGSVTHPQTPQIVGLCSPPHTMTLAGEDSVMSLLAWTSFKRQHDVENVCITPLSSACLGIYTLESV